MSSDDEVAVPGDVMVHLAVVVEKVHVADAGTGVRGSVLVPVYSLLWVSRGGRRCPLLQYLVRPVN